MSVIGSLAVKHLKRSWKQALQVILVYLLCTCFFIAEGMTVYSYIQSAGKEKIDTFGEQSGFLSGCTAENVHALKQLDSVQKVGVIQSVAIHTIPDAVYGNQIIAGTADETARSLCHIRTASGRLPEKADEIALERSALARLREEIEVGDRLELTFQTADGRRDKKNFTVVGILEDFSSLQIPEDSTLTLPNVLISEAYRDALQAGEEPAVCPVLVTDEKAAGQVLERFVKEGLGTAYALNPLLTGQGELPFEINTMGFVLLAVTGFFCLLMLYCLSVIMRKNRRQRIALLKVAGFTRGEVLLYYVMQGLLQLVPGFVIGCSLGILMSHMLVRYLGGFVHFFWNPVLFSACAALILLTAFFFILLGAGRDAKASPAELLSGGWDQKTPARTTSFFTKNPYLLWAGKDILLNSGEAVSTSIAMLFAVLILIVGGFVSSGVQNVADHQLPADIDIRVYDGGTFGPLGIPNDIAFGMTRQDAQALETCPQVEKAIALSRVHLNELKRADSLTAQEREEQALSGRGNDAYQKEKLKWGYDPDQELIESLLSGADAGLIRELEPYVTKGALHMEALSNAREVLVCETGEYPASRDVGDQITYTQIINDPATGKQEKRTFTVTVGAIVTLSDYDQPRTIEELALGGRTLWANSSFEKVGLTVRTNQVLLNFKNAEQTDEVEKQINNLQYNYKGQVTVQEYLQKAQRERAIAQMISMITFLLTLVLSIFAVVSLMVALNLKFQTRKGAFGTLRAIGMTKNEIYLVTLLQSVMQIGIAVLLGLIFSLGICFLLTTQMSELTLALFPWGRIVWIPVLLILVAALSCIGPVRHLYHDTASDCLRT